MQFIKNVNRDLPECSAVPKTTAPQKTLKQPDWNTSGVDGRTQGHY